ncbi:hypothetical protein CapIbe_021268 [Capra ibex]
MPLSFSSEDHKDVSSSSWKQATMCCSPSESFFERSSRAVETEVSNFTIVPSGLLMSLTDQGAASRTSPLQVRNGGAGSLKPKMAQSAWETD